MKPRPLARYDDFVGYQAGKPIEEVTRELGLTRVVKLASNENPHPPHPAVHDAVARDVAQGHRYPDDLSHDLATALAAFHGVGREQILLGAGSTDVLTFSWRVVSGPGDLGVYGWPSFVMYPVAGFYSGATNVPVPLRSGALDLDALLDAVRRPEARILAFCNPNNPTGSHVGHDDAIAFLDQVPEHVLVVNDEAYFDYADAADYPRLLPTVAQRPNVLTTRTFSKVYGLAGFRVGYGVGHASLVSTLTMGRNPFAVSRLAQVAAMEALRHQDEVVRRVKDNSQERDRLLPLLAQRGFEPLPTQGNFVFVTPPDDRDWFDLLVRQGVIVRPMPEGLRITFGTAEEDDFLLHAIDTVSA